MRGRTTRTAFFRFLTGKGKEATQGARMPRPSRGTRMADVTPDTIAAAATGPKQASVDGQSATAHSIPDQIKAAKFHAQSKQARKDRLPFRFLKIHQTGDR